MDNNSFTDALQAAMDFIATALTIVSFVLSEVRRRRNKKRQLKE